MKPEQEPTLGQLESRLAGFDHALRKVRSVRDQLKAVQDIRVGRQNYLHPAYDLSQPETLMKAVIRRGGAVISINQKTLPKLETDRRSVTESIQAFENTRDSRRIEELLRQGAIEPELALLVGIQLPALQTETTIKLEAKVEEAASGEEVETMPPSVEIAGSKKEEGESIEVFGNKLTGLTSLRRRAIEGGLCGTYESPLSAEEWTKYIYGEELDELEGISMKVALTRFYTLKGIIGKDLARVGHFVAKRKNEPSKKGGYYIAPLPEKPADDKSTEKPILGFVASMSTKGEISFQQPKALTKEKQQPTIQDVIDRCGLPRNSRFQAILEEVGRYGPQPRDVGGIAKVVYLDEINSGQISLAEAKLRVSSDISRIKKQLETRGITIKNATSAGEKRKGESSAYYFAWAEKGD